MIVGYARVSSIGQDHAVQIEKLRGAGAEKIFNEKQSGLDRERPELLRAIEFAREGDVLVVTKLDRLARSAGHLHQIVETLERKGVGFRVLDDASLDTTTRTGKLVFGILASIAEFETALRKERQMEGIAKAKAEGRTGGRPALVTDAIRDQMRALSREGKSIRKIAAEIGLSKATVHKVLAASSKGWRSRHAIGPLEGG